MNSTARKRTAGFLAAVFLFAAVGICAEPAVTAEDAAAETEAASGLTADQEARVGADAAADYTTSAQSDLVESARQQIEARQAQKAAEEKAAAEAAAEEQRKKEQEEAAAQTQASSGVNAQTTSLQVSANMGSSSYQNGLAAYIRSVNGSLSESTAQAEAAAFIRWGNQYGIRPEVLMAMAQYESSFNPNAGSYYYGLMQVSSSVGASYAGVSGSGLYDINANIHAGAAYLRANMNQFGGSTALGLSAYIYGSGAVRSGRYSQAPANARIQLANRISSYLTANGWA